MSWIDAILLALVEGLTEFLPVSSTGHMIMVSSWLGIAQDPFTKTFTVAIQFGAILSVVVLYWKRFFRSIDFYFRLFIAFLPAAVAGLLFEDRIDALLERVDVVGYMLILGGVFFLFMDQIFKPVVAQPLETDALDAPAEENPESEITYFQALKIGAFQIIAMIPGVSRSAATIIGGLSQRLTRKTAAEFSFFLAVPTMFAATGYKLYKFYKGGNSFGGDEITLLLVGNIVAFIVALIAIRSFIAYLTKYGFKVFGYYRIIAGIVVLLLYYLGAELTIV
jgi:undecaprenyl-diphosphatase